MQNISADDSPSKDDVRFINSLSSLCFAIRLGFALYSAIRSTRTKRIVSQRRKRRRMAWNHRHGDPRSSEMSTIEHRFKGKQLHAAPRWLSDDV